MDSNQIEYVVLWIEEVKLACVIQFSMCTASNQNCKMHACFVLYYLKALDYCTLFLSEKGSGQNIKKVVALHTQSSSAI